MNDFAQALFNRVKETHPDWIQYLYAYQKWTSPGDRQDEAYFWFTNQADGVPGITLRSWSGKIRWSWGDYQNNKLSIDEAIQLTDSTLKCSKGLFFAKPWHFIFLKQHQVLLLDRSRLNSEKFDKVIFWPDGQ